jgi:hypothetical protein
MANWKLCDRKWGGTGYPVSWFEPGTFRIRIICSSVFAEAKETFENKVAKLDKKAAIHFFFGSMNIA